MPLLYFEMVKGRSDEEIRKILDAAHDVVLKSFTVPARDRYQIVREYEPAKMIIQDTGLGISRTNEVIVVQVISRPRTREMKETFYSGLVQRLAADCGISPSDIVVTFVTNTDDDWSFGLGRAQFLTGEL